MTAKTCDFECYQLAAHFLKDEPCSDDPVLFEKHCTSLGLWIQEAVEDWFFSPDDEQPAAALTQHQWGSENV